MTYILKNDDGKVIASSNEPIGVSNWQIADEKDPAYIEYLDSELAKQDPFRESDIQLARVLEDLIEILMSRNLVSFTDFPSAAQKRLNERQKMRHRNRLSLLDDGDDLLN